MEEVGRLFTDILVNSFLQASKILLQDCSTGEVQSVEVIAEILLVSQFIEKSVQQERVLNLDWDFFEYVCRGNLILEKAERHHKKSATTSHEQTTNLVLDKEGFPSSCFFPSEFIA
jgi:hypothetical protein